MGFIKDLFGGVADLIKAPFEGVASVVGSGGYALGQIIHGAGRTPCDPYLTQSALGCQGTDPYLALQLQQLQAAMATNMMLNNGMYPRCCCCG